MGTWFWQGYGVSTPLTIFLALLVLHFVGDFLLQNDWMALNKSKAWTPLLLHVSVYSICFGFFGMSFLLVTFFSHLLVDAITSRVNARLWFIQMEQRELLDGWFYGRLLPSRHWFFVAIGFDQLLHLVQLLLTAKFVGLF
jgi:hypothetical protein